MEIYSNSIQAEINSFIRGFFLAAKTIRGSGYHLMEFAK